jgi:HEPN domain-containing protein
MLVQRGVVFPYVHDLARLLTLLEEAGEEVPEAVRQAEGLTRYAVLSRYPGLVEPVTEGHYQEALANAEVLVSWAEDRIR